MSREEPYLHCHLSYTIFFLLSSVESHELVQVRTVEEVSEGDASTKVIASFTALTTQKPQKEQNLLTYI